MTDHPPDPLAGRDPYPREQIDVLGLHRERADLLEEIVSTPSAGPASTRTKVLLPVGIAAALAVVGGGIWFATSGDDESGNDPVVAASTTPEPTEPDAAEPTGDAEPTDQASQSDDVRTGGVQVGEVGELDEAKRGDVLSADVCRELRDGWRVGPRRGMLLLEGRNKLRVVPESRDGEIRLRELRTTLKDLSEIGRLPKGSHAYYLDGPRGGWLAIDADCTVVARGDGPWIDYYAKPKPRG